MRSIFRRYAELGSVRLLKAELETQERKSKSWTSAAGRAIGGKPFSRGALYLMLRNRTYRGEIVHNGQSHPSEHPPIIDQLLWDAAQMRLAGNTAERNAGTRTHQPSLLAGMLFDAEGNRMTPSYAVKKGTRYRYYVSRPLITQDQRESSSYPGTRTRQPRLLAGMLFDRDGNRMTPTHAVKKGTRYHYYVSRPLITKDQTERSAGRRIPAGEIEQIVTSRVRQWLLDPNSIYQATRLPDLSAQRRLVARTAEIGKSWPEVAGTRQRAILTALIERIDVGADQIDPSPAPRYWNLAQQRH